MHLLCLQNPVLTTEDLDTEKKLSLDYWIQTVGWHYPTFEIRGDLL